MKQPTFMLAGIPLANVLMSSALDIIFEAVDRKEPCREMHFANAHCINVASVNEAYRTIIKQASAVFADGSGIRKAGEMLGTPIVDNVNGTDMFPLLCRRCAEEKRSIFLLGSEPGIAEKTARWANEHAGSVVVSGYQDGFFPEEETASVITKINEAHPDILLVAMGVPRQEIWIHHHLSALQVPVAMGVGGLFDFFSGKISRAPGFMRKFGIEWVWRLMMEPRRMWRRYIIGNIVFLRRIKKLVKNSDGKLQ